MNIEDAMVSDLQVPKELISDAIALARVRVKRFKIKKRSGEDREIFHPSKKLKLVQYWLIHRVFRFMPVHEAAMAYRPGVSILHNAQIHSKNRFFLKMDFKDFFPSIRFRDLAPSLEEWHANSQPGWILGEDGKNLINNACFFREDRLAVGYPSSPIISNIVMRTFDALVSASVGSGDYGNAIYTRYADDMVFSTDRVGACRALLGNVEAIVNDLTSPRLQINHKKTRLGSSTGGTAFVTGLAVCSDGHITIKRKLKSHIRLMLSLYSKGKLKPDDVHSLSGHLAYCQHVAPQFFSGLAKKYFSEIHRIRSGER